MVISTSRLSSIRRTSSANGWGVGYRTGHSRGFTYEVLVGQSIIAPKGEHDLSDVIEAAERYADAEGMTPGEVLHSALEVIEDITEETKDNLVLAGDIEQPSFDARGTDRSGQESRR